jgi:hypothetical protein
LLVAFDVVFDGAGLYADEATVAHVGQFPPAEQFADITV